jgi:hypothetical protein
MAVTDRIMIRHGIRIIVKPDFQRIVMLVINSLILIGIALILITTNFSLLLDGMLRQHVNPVIVEAYIEALQKIVMDATEVIMNRHEIRIIVQPDFQPHATTAIVFKIQHGIKEDSIIASRLPLANMLVILVQHVIPIQEITRSSPA